MARQPRMFKGGVVYHVMNRASARAKVFLKDADYAAFEAVLGQAVARFGMRVLSYVVMPNHFHLVLWPAKGQGATVSRFMQWLQQTHTQRWHSRYHNAGEGRLYQGRFRAFPVQSGFVDWQHVRRVCRYVERNALRAGLVKRGEGWRWGSLWRRMHGTAEEKRMLAAWPQGAYPGDGKWVELVNRAMAGKEEQALRESLARGRPFGEDKWVAAAAVGLGLGHTLRGRGRPRKHADGPAKNLEEGGE